jgi:hypothetical protein
MINGNLLKIELFRQGKKKKKRKITDFEIKNMLYAVCHS